MAIAASLSAVRTGALLAVLVRGADVEAGVENPQTFRPGEWAALVGAFPVDDVAWTMLHVPYTVGNGGGARSKLVFVTWAPDTIQRATHRETIRVKSSAHTSVPRVLSDAVKTLGTLPYQANDRDDLDAGTVVRRAARFELEPLDPASIDALRGTGDRE